MRIYIFDEDPSFLDMMTLYLNNLGHSAQGFPSAYSCPLYLMEQCACPADKPCADALLVNIRKPDAESLNMFIDQDDKGCKLPRLNKAVMSAGFSEEQEKFIRAQGFSVFKKPFRLMSVDEWLGECADRLAKPSR